MLENDHCEVNIDVSLMHLVQDDMSHCIYKSGVIDQSLEEDSCRHKEDLGILAESIRHANVVPHVIANILTHFLGNSLSNVDGCQSSWLSAYDLCILVRLEHILGNLRSLATASVSTDDCDLIVKHSADDLVLLLVDGQIDVLIHGSGDSEVLFSEVIVDSCSFFFSEVVLVSQGLPLFGDALVEFLKLAKLLLRTLHCL